MLTSHLGFALRLRVRVRARAHSSFGQFGRTSEEVRHGDVTAGVKRAWNVITADKCSFFHS